VVAPRLENYAEKYRHAKLQRTDGILQVTMHSDGEPLVWGGGPHEEFGYLFEDIGRDPYNKVIILTGEGDAFIGHENLHRSKPMSPRAWQHIHSDGKRLLMSHLDIEVPVIAAVNGDATVHAELALLCDIVICADHASFADDPHFTNGLVPGDGVHVVWPLLLGMNRGRYFLLTGQRLSAQEALALGVVNEVLPADDVLPRAWELARVIAQRPPAVLRATRTAMVHQIKTALHQNLGYGLMLEGVAAIDHWPSVGDAGQP
jgi:enoyl-CoA hydratase/carnithine racemase